jgi:hypothetical protein
MNDDFRRLLLLLHVVVFVAVAVDMQAVMELQRWMMMGLCAAAGAQLQNKLGAENCELWMEKEDLDET